MSPRSPPSTAAGVLRCKELAKKIGHIVSYGRRRTPSTEGPRTLQRVGRRPGPDRHRFALTTSGVALAILWGGPQASALQPIHLPKGGIRRLLLFTLSGDAPISWSRGGSGSSLDGSPYALARTLWKSRAPSAEPRSASNARSGWGMMPSTLPSRLDDAGDGARRAVGVVAIAEHHLAFAFQPVEGSSSAKIVALAVADRHHRATRLAVGGGEAGLGVDHVQRPPACRRISVRRCATARPAACRPRRVSGSRCRCRPRPRRARPPPAPQPITGERAAMAPARR